MRGTPRCIHQIFENQAAATPDSIAVVLSGQQLTYRVLNERSNQLAHYLRKLGVGPDVLVGICVDRTLELVVTILGVLKAGGAYVPIDPQYPRERLAFMLEDSRSPVMVAEQALAGDLTMPSTTVVFIDRDWERISREAVTNPASGVGPEHLAYVIYTSGSTGLPKGTLISHRNVVRLFQSTHAWFDFTARDVWTLFHSCAFDFSVWELWGALLYGGKLVVVPFGISRTPESFYRLLCEEQVTVLNQTPSAFRQLMRAEESAAQAPALALRLVIFGGEALDFKSLEPWFDRHGDQRPQLVNMYGITETTVHVTYRPISSKDLGGSSVIGAPIPDLQIYLMDEAGVPVPVGVPGEIYVGGAGVARGYLNRPELSAQKFIPDPFAADPARRLYRSGDLGRYLPNGDLEYLGRIDQQVKIRGFRIELGEISAAINRDPSIRDSVVSVSEARPGEKALVAHLVRRDGGDVNIPALRQMLRERLPEYMVPSAFSFIERIPLTVNGKLDLKALPGPEKAQTAPTSPMTGGTALEQGIGRIWREVLQLPSVGLEQNFFDVGGNSVNLVQIHERLQRLLEREFSITDLFAHSTVRALAAHFAGKDDAGVATPGSSIGASAVRAQRQREALSALRSLRRERK
jgi:amino acid adenylation domain-containing protein